MGVLWAIGVASVVSRTLANDVGFHRNGAGGAVQFVVQTAAKTLRLETVKKITDVHRLALVVLPPERSRSSVVPCNKAGFKLVAVALGPDERVMAAVWVRRVKVGRPVGVLERVCS